MENVLSAEAANSSVGKHYKEEIAELMDCLDLTYHHHIKNLVTVYNTAKDNIRTGLERQMTHLTQACSSLDAKKDKEIFLVNHESLFLEPQPFKYDFYREFQAGPEVRQQNIFYQQILSSSFYQEMNQKKKITDDQVEILRKKSETLRQQIEGEEKKLLHIINSLSLAK